VKGRLTAVGFGLAILSFGDGTNDAGREEWVFTDIKKWVAEEDRIAERKGLSRYGRVKKKKVHKPGKNRVRNLGARVSHYLEIRPKKESLNPTEEEEQRAYQEIDNHGRRRRARESPQPPPSVERSWRVAR